MSEHDNTNRGAIWKNPKKVTDKHPDFTGSLNVDGIEFWVSAWRRKEGASEKSPALSFQIQPKDEAKPEPKKSGGTFAQMESDIPFAAIGKYL
jgi:hypothetical protein